jgi:nicotinate phosphoribosyltransferase
VYKKPTSRRSTTNCRQQLDTLWTSQALRHPHNYYVDLSQKLYDIKLKLLESQNA